MSDELDEKQSAELAEVLQVYSDVLSEDWPRTDRADQVLLEHAALPQLRELAREIYELERQHRGASPYPGRAAPARRPMAVAAALLLIGLLAAGGLTAVRSAQQILADRGQIQLAKAELARKDAQLVALSAELRGREDAPRSREALLAQLSQAKAEKDEVEKQLASQRREHEMVVGDLRKSLAMATERNTALEEEREAKDRDLARLRQQLEHSVTINDRTHGAGGNAGGAAAGAGQSGSDSAGGMLASERGLVLAIEGSTLMALSASSDSARGGDGGAGRGMRPADQLRAHARMSFEASDRLLRQAAPAGELAKRFHDAADQYASTLRRLGEALEREPEAGGGGNRVDPASVALINLAVERSLDASALKRTTRMMGGSDSPAFRSLLMHSQEFERESRQILQVFADRPGGGDEGHEKLSPLAPLLSDAVTLAQIADEINGYRVGGDDRGTSGAASDRGDAQHRSGRDR